MHVYVCQLNWNVSKPILATTSENVPPALYTQRRFKSVCASAHTVQSLITKTRLFKYIENFTTKKKKKKKRKIFI